MVRIKRGNIARKRRRKILNYAKSYKGAHSTIFKIANQQVMKALKYSYIGRKQKKRNFRRVWISRINIASKIEGTNYSKLINQLNNSNILLNRKMLAQLSILDSSTFTAILNFD